MKKYQLAILIIMIVNAHLVYSQDYVMKKSTGGMTKLINESDTILIQSAFKKLKKGIYTKKIEIDNQEYLFTMEAGASTVLQNSKGDTLAISSKHKDNFIQLSIGEHVYRWLEMGSDHWGYQEGTGAGTFGEEKDFEITLKNERGANSTSLKSNVKSNHSERILEMFALNNIVSIVDLRAKKNTSRVLTVLSAVMIVISAASGR